jgi:hypothetical protein
VIEPVDKREQKREQKEKGHKAPDPIDIMAERAGFEPAVGLTLRTLSRRVT